MSYPYDKLLTIANVSKRRTIMALAYGTLRAELNKDREYPDAHTKACTVHNLTLKEGEQLGIMYAWDEN